MMKPFVWYYIGPLGQPDLANPLSLYAAIAAVHEHNRDPRYIDVWVVMYADGSLAVTP